MKLSKNNENGFYLSFNGNDTYNWANRINCRWPCSILSDKSGFVVVDNNGLCDISDNLYDCSSDELIAFISDMLNSKNYKHYKQARKFWPIWEN